MIAKKSYYKKESSLDEKTIETLRAKLKSKAYMDFAINGIGEGFANAYIEEGEDVKRKKPKSYSSIPNKTNREKIREYVDRIRCLMTSKKKAPSEREKLKRAIMLNFKNRHK